MKCSKCSQPMECIDQQEEWFDTFDPARGHSTKETGRMILTYTCEKCGITDEIVKKYEVFE